MKRLKSDGLNDRNELVRSRLGTLYGEVMKQLSTVRLKPGLALEITKDRIVPELKDIESMLQSSRAFGKSSG